MADEAKEKSGLYGKEPAGKPIDTDTHKAFEYKKLTPGGSTGTKTVGKSLNSDKVIEYKDAEYPTMKLNSANPFLKMDSILAQPTDKK